MANIYVYYPLDCDLFLFTLISVYSFLAFFPYLLFKISIDYLRNELMYVWKSRGYTHKRKHVILYIGKMCSKIDISLDFGN